MAKTKVYLREVYVGDDDSVMLLLDFDRVRNPEKVVDSIKAAQQYWGGSIKLRDAIRILVNIWLG